MMQYLKTKNTAGLLRFSARVLAAGLTVMALGAGSLAAQGTGKLRVALVSGSEAGAYQANRGMEVLKDFLEKNYPIEGILITSEEGSDTFTNLQALRTADTAIFFVRRKTPPPDDLALIREFFESGKGFVALRPTSHAWENWPTFDRDVFGVTYERGRFAEGTPMEVFNLYPHPIYAGVSSFKTDQYMYNLSDLADDAQILMEGVIGETTVPLAWARNYKGGRALYLVPGSIELFQDASYQRIVGNAAMWAARRPVPGAETLVQRTFMPEAHPGAFAITFPEGPGVCYDPVRGGINYIWDGDFIDLRPRWLTKQGQPARFFGDVFYREKEWQPMRAGSRDREPDYQFKGYRMKNGTPEFSYEINGRAVIEELRGVPGGNGVERRFRVERGEGPLWIALEAQKDAEVSVSGARREGNFIRFDGAGEFTVTIRMKGNRS